MKFRVCVYFVADFRRMQIQRQIRLAKKIKQIFGGQKFDG